MFHSDETPKSENYFTLKVSPRPVKHYKIVSFEEEKLWDYDAIIDKLKQMAYLQQTLDRKINPKRGTIYDATGKVILATSSSVEIVTINPLNIAAEDKEKQ